MEYLATKLDTFNNNHDNSFDKDIPNADSQKVHFEPKNIMYGKYVSYVCRMRGKRDIGRHDKREAMYYDEAGSLCILGIM